MQRGTRAREHARLLTGSLPRFPAELGLSICSGTLLVQISYYELPALSSSSLTIAFLFRLLLRLSLFINTLLCLCLQQTHYISGGNVQLLLT